MSVNKGGVEEREHKSKAEILKVLQEQEGRKNENMRTKLRLLW